MNDLERQVRDTLLRHQDDAPRFDVSEAHRAAGRARRRQVRSVVVGAIGAAAVIVAFAGIGGLVRADRIPNRARYAFTVAADAETGRRGCLRLAGTHAKPGGRLLVGREPLSPIFPNQTLRPHTQRIRSGLG